MDALLLGTKRIGHGYAITKVSLNLDSKSCFPQKWFFRKIIIIFFSILSTRGWRWRTESRWRLTRSRTRCFPNKFVGKVPKNETNFILCVFSGVGSGERFAEPPRGRSHPGMHEMQKKNPNRHEFPTVFGQKKIPIELFNFCRRASPW